LVANQEPIHLTEQQEDILEKNLVWIFGSPRSGTTWLASELLSNHSFCFHEPLLGEHISSVRELGGNIIRRIDEDRNRPHYFFSDSYKSTWKYYMRKLILHRIHAQFPLLHKTIVIKEPNGSFASDIIAETLPNSKIIIILRDPRDILLSQVTALSKGGYATKEDKRWDPLGGQRKLNFLKIMSKRWVALVDVLLRTYENHAEDNRLLLKYEELRNNTKTELRKIFDFLDFKADDKELEEIIAKYDFENLPSESKGLGTTRQFATPGKWKEKFNLVERKIIEDIISEKQQKIGYT